MAADPFSWVRPVGSRCCRLVRALLGRRDFVDCGLARYRL